MTQLSTGFSVFIVGWTVVLVSLMGIGGFFMFRKFLKSMPKQDGKSELDWQDYYIEQTRSMWTEDGLALLNELVEPVPQLFRDVARRSIAAKIGKLALDEKATSIDLDLIVKGYILATPKRDHKFLIDHLKKKQIDYSPYEKYLHMGS
ncbi:MULTISPECIES: DUF2621 domain-containing protein [Brevibacillus]|jgi:hypothetical protein|uniref:DUF2621 domain-containing protein n=1 Tax=Brevibacillus borstelensis AK1 TaxID=1300222 RepID=M8E3G2_9BACL|nr:DUF2621 domain-containing protein [Brevibacillus borstelensis]EMT53821.1 hypothetical protein I532_07395 [Brevibacillus borstelensis AK1]KKX56777.1 hypothetical protein X546_02050 [Brevibacillus borstelensis cifa_chp40]MBE5395741.1 DUF2621 domain-containing protein [Brevibacillus borstelensis]MCC0566335.1 DUF2621 domain-containing protein [Brevibacillus borstelensis]MCM3473429.1 DUF2621 domain-containing protein [Brevibacillus borstelensis]